MSLELVPRTSWYDNLRTHISNEDWDKIRRRTHAKYKYRCAICGAKGRLNCHEIWEYYDKERIQMLVGFAALCGLCDRVTHIDLAGVRASEGNLDYEKAVEHFMKVNECDRRTFERHREDAFRKWGKRSKHEWTVDLGQYKSMVEAADMTDG